MKILLIHNEYGRTSGEEVVFYQQADILAQAGFDVRTFVRTSRDIKNSLGGKANAFKEGIWSMQAQSQVREVVTAFKPEIVQIQNLYPLISSSITPVLERAGAAIVYSAHNLRLFCPTGLMLRAGKFCQECATGGEIRAVRHNCEGSLPRSVGYAARNWVTRATLIPAVDRYLVLSSFQKNKFTEFGLEADRISVVPNMLRLGYPVCDSIELLGGRDIVGYVGRISPEKGLHVLAKAAGYLPELRFVCIGHTERFPDNLRDAPRNVEFVGEVKPDELPKWFKRMRALVIPSICHEGFPMTALEAMANGVPIIASRSGGLMDIVEHEVSGLLVAMNDAIGLVEAIKRVWTQNEVAERFAQNGLERVRNVFSRAAWIERMEIAYARALNSRALRYEVHAL